MADKRTSTSSSARRAKDSAKYEVDIGMFRRQEEIGKGSFATVYKASVHKKPGFVAIKSVDLHRLNKKLKENLYSEIHILKGLHHPHIVSLIDCKETSAHIHLIMEFCELGDLSYFIKKKDSLHLHETMKDMIAKYPNPPGGGLNEVIVRHLLKQLSNAVEFLRAKNFIHRDVKPQNLLLDPSPHYYETHNPAAFPFSAHERSLVPNVGVETLPTLKLADFGFARSLPSTSLAETLCGSPLYMAPEILRYEKYDARVDLWSIGTVLYEMLVGRPPFKASNHVELLRKIEKGEDRIAFPSEIHVSDSLKNLVRGLLKRHPGERMSFNDFFNHTVIKDEIPGLTDEDRALQLPKSSRKPRTNRSEDRSDESLAIRTPISDFKSSRPSTREVLSGSPQDIGRMQDARFQPRPVVTRTSSGQQADRLDSRDSNNEQSRNQNRPGMVSHATAPARHDLHSYNKDPAVIARKSSGTSLSSQEKAEQRERAMQMREIRERAAQDVAFERDYVLVEKKAVEVNAFADELAASPRIHGGTHDTAVRNALKRRSTQQGPPLSTTGAQATPSRAMQIVSTKRPESSHDRRNSYERRLRDQPSATSAISKAINLASGRLFGMGFSPPLGVGRSGPSPPSYAPFPTYPANQGSVLMIEDSGKKGAAPLDEDAKTVQIIEDSATRSDVVYGFAEVKYKQLIPLAPSVEHGLGLRQTNVHESQNAQPEEAGLTVDAIVTLSEEALVLYVKALSILARAMDFAGTWWLNKNHGEVVEDFQSQATSAKGANNAKIGNRVNNVVQWIRGRFNETLEKAEFVGLKLRNAQKQLPLDHPSHPCNHPTSSQSSSLGNDQVVVTSGITAEKLMYERALEMSRSAAVNELVGEDLQGCELAYVTAIRMLEAVLEDDSDSAPKKLAAGESHSKSGEIPSESVNGVEEEDRKVVVKLVQSVRNRLQALRKKMHVISRRSSMNQQQIPTSLPTKPSPRSHSSSPAPAIATTPPP